MDATKLLEHLGRSMGVEDIAFNTQGCASLLFDNRIALNLESDREAVRLTMTQSKVRWSAYELPSAQDDRNFPDKLTRFTGNANRWCQ